MAQKDKFPRKTVIIMANKTKYRDQPYFAVPEFDKELGYYRTGQESAVKWHDKDNMTIVDKTKFDKLILVIDPKKYYPLVHKHPLIVKKAKTIEPDTKDDIMYKFFSTLRNVVTDKRRMNSARHSHLLESAEDNALVEIEKFEKVAKAIDLVRDNTTFDSLRDIGLLLGMDVGRLSKALIESGIYKLCQSNPDKILECFADDATEKLIVYKLTHHKILEFKEERYWYGTRVIGDMNGVIEFMKSQDETKASLTGNWLEQLKSKTEE